MEIVTTSELLKTLQSYELLMPKQLKALEAEVKKYILRPQKVVRELIRNEWLTDFQARRILSGKAAQLRLGPYVLLEKIGQGGMGLVFKARHTKLGLIVALKCLRKDRMSSPVLVERFRRETEILLTLSHRNVIRAYHDQSVGNVQCLALEYIDGIDLGTLVRKKGPIPCHRACELIRQAAQGLQHAHEKGLVHRDIKPDNILLSQENDTEVVKLLDLGLARYVNPMTQQALKLTHEGVVVGSADFLSPEQAQDASAVDIRSDLYSLGCTFYFLLVGRAPFSGGTTMEKVIRHTIDPPPTPRHVGPPVIRILRKLMAKVPESRFQEPEDVAHELQWLLDHPQHLSARRAVPAETAETAILPLNESAHASL